MPSGPERKIIKHGFAVWTNLPSTVVWFEAGKDWAHGLITGNWWERQARAIVLNLIAPGFGTAMNLVLEYDRGKLKRHVGPNGIWVALKVIDPKKALPVLPPLVHAKKRTPANKLKVPDPWEPAKGNVL